MPGTGLSNTVNIFLHSSGSVSGTNADSIILIPQDRIPGPAAVPTLSFI